MVMEIVISLIFLFVGITVLVCIHFCIVGRAFGRDGDDNNNNNQDRTTSEDTTQGQSNNTTMKVMSGDIGDLKNLPCFDYEEEEKGNSNSSSSLVDCAICLESFKVGDACRLLPNCNHSFHVQCIDSWILKTPFCPICRTRVMIREESAVPVPDSVEIEMP